MEWIDPIGGLGDNLILSGVLYDVWQTTGRQFGLVRRPPYRSFFRGHPAIAAIAVPPPDARRIKVDYWFMEPLGAGNARPYQILARRFGLETPREELRWMLVGEADFERNRLFPIADGCIVVGPTSLSPRKEWPHDNWAQLVDRIRGAGGPMVVQVGVDRDRKIPGTVSLCGLTGPRDVAAIMKRAALAVLVDAFPLHVAAWAGTRAVGLWGPSDPAVFGYPWHTNLRSQTHCDDLCYAARDNDKYLVNCTQEKGHCMKAVTVDDVWAAMQPML